MKGLCLYPGILSSWELGSFQLRGQYLDQSNIKCSFRTKESTRTKKLRMIHCAQNRRNNK